MNSGSNIRAVGAHSAPEAQVNTADEMAEEPFTLEEEWADTWEDEAPPPRNFGWIVPVLAMLVIAGWTGFYGWVNRFEILGGGTPAQWSGWIIAWSVPVLLVVCVWMLAIRNSRREAIRFGEVARLLSGESATLETRLSSVNRELSMARDFLGAQSRELEALGRVASERLSLHADDLQNLIQNNSKQVDAIATVSNSALENMVRLRDDLPVIANSARDVSNQIGGAGRTAHGQIDELVSGFQRLNEFGKASERQVGDLQVKIDAALAGFEAQAAHIDEISSVRLGELRSKSEGFRTDLDQREVEVLAALRRRADVLAEELAGSRGELEDQEEQALVSMRTRLAALRGEAKQAGSSVREGEQAALGIWNEQIDAMQSRLSDALEKITALDQSAVAASNAKLKDLAASAEQLDNVMSERSNVFFEQISARREQMTQDEQEAIEVLTARLAEVDEAIAARRSQQIEQTTNLTEHGEAIAQRLASLQSELSVITAQGLETSSVLGDGAEILASKLSESRNSIDTTSDAIRLLTEDTVRLLELIQASSQHSREDLPAAIGEASGQLDQAEDRVKNIHLMLSHAGERGKQLSEYVLKSKDEGRLAIDQVEEFHTRLTAANAQHDAEIGKLQQSLSELSSSSEDLTGKAKSELSDAIAILEKAAGDTVARIESGAAADIAALAGRIGSESAEAIDQALRVRTDEAIAQLGEETAKASSVSRQAAIHLRDQLVKVNELTGNLENRVARARERAEEEVNNDFSRRVALITDSLNSNAIDITKALSSEVTDTAWASYLRGDRGIFTRRAVQLLDNAQARDIAEVYVSDDGFSENVSRYIHDFEAMLRAMLSTRDGNSLGVTLLSSDMGKLYVALAQSIERLRS